MADYKLKVIIEGVDQLSGPFRGVQNLLGGIVSTAGGMLAAMGIQSLVQGVKSMGAAALDAYADYERLGLTLTSLLGVEKMNATAGLSLADAMGQSSGKAKELLGWVTNLAIFSPFTEETVSMTLQTAMGYGMTSKMAQNMTQALVDYGAGTGKSTQQTELLGLALGQVWAKGKLTGEEMRQLTNAGLGVGTMARAMGMSVADLTKAMEKGEISAEKLIPAFIALSSKEFPNAAKNMATSWSGLTSTIGDIGKIGLRNLFEGTFKAIQPYVADFVNKFSDPKFMAAVNELGQKLGGMVAEGIRTIGALIVEYGPRVMELGNTIQNVLGAALNWLTINVLPLVMEAMKWLGEHIEAVKGAFLAIGAVLGGAMVAGVLGIIIGLLGAVLSPIGLLIAAVAIFGAAWAEDWGGMRTKLTEFWEKTAKPAFEQLVKWFQENLPKAMAAVSDFWVKTLQPALAGLGKFIVDDLIPALLKLWGFFNDYILPILLSVANVIKESVVFQFKQIGAAWEDTIKPALEGMWRWLNDNFMPWMQGLGKALEPVLKPIQDMWDKFGGIEGVLKSIKQWLDDIAKMLSTMPTWKPPWESQVMGLSMAGGTGGTLGGGAVAGAFGGDVFNITINDQASAGMVLAFIEERRSARLNAFMGVN